MEDITQYVRKQAIGFDTETHMMGMGCLCPKLVCLSMSSTDCTDVQSVNDPESFLRENIEMLLTSDAAVAHNTAFDLAVLANYRPELLPQIFQGLEDGIFEDTIVREKLIHLSTHGDLEFLNLPDGVTMKIGYSLADLAKRYLGKNRTDDKEVSDSWRTNFKELEKIPVSQWPPDAIKYVSEDSEDVLNIREIQESERLKIWQKIGRDPFATQDFQVAVSFSLYLMSAWGFCVDAEAKAKIERMLTEELSAERMTKLVASGILRPGTPARPFKNGARNKDGTPKMSKPVEESIDTKILKDMVVAYCLKNNLEVVKTAPSDKYPDGQVSTAMEFFEEHHHADPVFEEYYKRQKLQKLVTTELPRMNWEGKTAAVVHPGFNVLVSTGRTSSMASKIYPSFNCQNVDPRVRGCFVPRKGYLFFSIDYTGMELGTLAQKCFSLFGHSVLRDKINANVDAHGYLGAQLAYHLNEDFRKSCDANNSNDPEQIFAAFTACKKSEVPEIKAFYKLYRTFAKPTGLGYPGGLGPDTFIVYAKGTYGVTVDLETAKLLREVWHKTFPEMKQYFNWINTCCHDLVDPDKFAYVTPMGMYRAGANYCATANGAALQSPSAEGAKLAVFNVIRACFDTTLGSILGDDDKGPTVRPNAFVHDEIIGEVRDDEKAHDRVYEIARIMVEAMRTITPDVTVQAQPVLMRRWNKSAEPVFDKNGRLTVWEEPKTL